MANTSFAIALFENEAESDDELTFAKNDFLEVLKFDYQEVKGWWLCKLIRTNEIGLAAGNRLKIIKSKRAKAAQSRQSPPKQAARHVELVYFLFRLLHAVLVDRLAPLILLIQVNLNDRLLVSLLVDS